MPSSRQYHATVVTLFLGLLVSASPAPAPTAAPNGAPARRGIISDIESYATSIAGNVETDIRSVLTGLGSDLPTWVASGILPYETAIPTGTAALSSAGVSPAALSASPTMVLNIPPYANWTEQGWNVRFHGNVYKTPNISSSKLDDLCNAFLIGTSVQALPPSQSAQAINVTKEIFVDQQSNEQPVFNLEPAPSAGGSGQPGGGGATTPTGGVQTVTYPSYNTTAEGDYDAFIPIELNGLAPGNTTFDIQRLNVYTVGTDTGNSTAYLVPPYGLTVISDIDDILRVTKIYEPAQGILNTFARPFVPWMNMPEIYTNWSTNLNPGFNQTHFHYLTTTPEQITRSYMSFIYANYPGGSFDTRPLNFSDISAVLSIRKFLLDKVFQTFPNRKFILVADTSNSDVMRDYPAMVTDYPGQVQCIFLRNTTHTDPGDQFPYDTSGFKGIPQSQYMFFRTPDDLTNLDIANGQCYNSSVPQNVTFGYQGLPFGINLGSGSSSSSASSSSATGSGNAAVSLGAGVFAGVPLAMGAPLLAAFVAGVAFML